MNILVDENTPLMTVRELREQGFEVTDIRGTEAQGTTDEVPWQKAQKGKRDHRRGYGRKSHLDRKSIPFSGFSTSGLSIETPRNHV